MSFLSHPDIQLTINHTSLYFLSVKEKDKGWEHELTLKVLIWFKTELVYSIWKPIMWKYNFSNSLNVQRSSQNIKFDSNKNVIKLAFFDRGSHVLCLWLQSVAVFFCFSIIIRHKKWQRLSQWGHKNRLFKHKYFNFAFWEICFLK